MLIIGENINATIPRVKKMIVGHDSESLVELARRQEAAGAAIIDVNVGTGEGTAEDEVDDMKWLVGLLRESVGCRLCVDSADTAVLKAGIDEGGDRVGMVNSVKATDGNIAEVMPLAAERGLPLIALCMDGSGIPKDAETRLKACERILKGAESHGVPAENLYFDPLVMPVSTDIRQGSTTLDTLRGIKENFPRAKTVLALSNISFGLPKRTLINQAMAHMAQYLNVDALLISPLDAALMTAVKAGEAVMGRDRHCRRYSRATRA
jgi:5-methyltetrahydrofolate corrinoid/iron sulfur protein methyltransferase